MIVTCRPRKTVHLLTQRCGMVNDQTVISLAKPLNPNAVTARNRLGTHSEPYRGKKMCHIVRECSYVQSKAAGALESASVAYCNSGCTRFCPAEDGIDSVVKIFHGSGVKIWIADLAWYSRVNSLEPRRLVGWKFEQGSPSIAVADRQNRPIVSFLTMLSSLSLKLFDGASFSSCSFLYAWILIPMYHRHKCNKDRNRYRD